MDIADKEYKKTEWPDHFRARGVVLISDSYKTFDDGWCCFKAIDEDGKLISIAVGPRDLDIILHLRRGLVVTYFRSSGGCHYYDMKPDKEFICFSKENKEDVLKHFCSMTRSMETMQSVMAILLERIYRLCLLQTRNFITKLFLKRPSNPRGQNMKNVFRVPLARGQKNAGQKFLKFEIF